MIIYMADGPNDDDPSGNVRSLLLRLGRKHFGSPDAETLAAVEAITDLARLERLGEQLLDAVSWRDLLATP